MDAGWGEAASHAVQASSKLQHIPCLAASVAQHDIIVCALTRARPASPSQFSSHRCKGNDIICWNLPEMGRPNLLLPPAPTFLASRRDLIP